jgi:hypothetical protein
MSLGFCAKSEHFADFLVARIRLTLLAWIVHRTFTKLQSEARRHRKSSARSMSAAKSTPRERNSIDSNLSSTWASIDGCTDSGSTPSESSFDPTQSKIAALQSLDRSTSTRHSKPSVAQLQSLLSNKPPHHAQEVPISYAPKPKHEPRFIRKKLSIAHFFAPQEASDIAARRAGDHPRPKTFLHKSQHKQSSSSEDHADHSIDHEDAGVLPGPSLSRPSSASSTYESRSGPLVTLAVNEAMADMMEIDEQSPLAAASESSTVDSTHLLHAGLSSRIMHVGRSSNADKVKAAASKSPGQCFCNTSADLTLSMDTQKRLVTGAPISHPSSTTCSRPWASSPRP